MNIRNALLKFAYNKKLRIMGQIIKKGKKVSLHRNDNRRSNQKGWENMETAKYAKIWEEDVVIPTYEIGAPDKNPMFLEKRVYQGSSGKVYPYPTTEKISHEKKDKIWHAVYLENEYLKVMILPELGGRIQRAYDKTNDYDFVYYNHVFPSKLKINKRIICTTYYS